MKEEIFRTQDMERINTIPPKKPYAKIFGWTLSAVIIGLIVYGFITNTQTGMRQLSSWILWNGGLSALFVALSFAHPLSILTAFVAAPITSLNPMLACGWFAGLVQASVRKPARAGCAQRADGYLQLQGLLQKPLPQGVGRGDPRQYRQ